MADGPMKDRITAVEEAFPYQRIRTFLDVTERCISKLDSSHLNTDLASMGIDSHDRGVAVLWNFMNKVLTKFKNWDPDMRDLYTTFWAGIGEVCTYDVCTAREGNDGLPKDSSIRRYLDILQSSPTYRKYLEECQRTMHKENYPALFQLILDRLTKGVQNPDYIAGFSLAARDASVLVSQL